MADGDVTEIETEQAPTLEQLQAQNRAMQAQLQQAAQKEEQYLAALAGVDATRRQAPKPVEPTGDDEPLDPATEKALKKMRAEHAQQLSEVQDQHDEMSFYQYAASGNLDPKLVAETSKTYSEYRANGVRVRDSQGRERPMTRLDVLHQVAGRQMLGEQFKAAPEKNLAALKARMLGGAGFEPGVGTSGSERFVKLDSELDKAPRKERVSKLEKALTGHEF